MHAPLPQPNQDIEIIPFSGLIQYERQRPIRQVSYYFCGEIQAPQFYTEPFYTLRTASETGTSISTPEFARR